MLQNHTLPQNQIFRKNTQESQETEQLSLWGLNHCSQVLAKSSFIITLHILNMCHAFEVLNKKIYLGQKKNNKNKQRSFLELYLLGLLCFCVYSIVALEILKKDMKVFLSKSPFIQHMEKTWWQLSHFLILCNRFQCILFLTFKRLYSIVLKTINF